MLQRPFESALHTAIGVVDQSGLRTLLLDGHRQCRGSEFDLHMIAHGPADNLPAEEIHDGRQIQPPLRGGECNARTGVSVHPGSTAASAFLTQCR